MKVRQPLKKQEEVLLVYIGEYLDTKKVPILGFIRVSQEEFDGNCILDEALIERPIYYFDKKKLKKYITPGPGVVYRVPATIDEENNSFLITAGQAKYVGMWFDDDQRAIWQERERLRRAERTLRKEEKEAKEDNALMQSLQTARRVYREAPGFQKELVIARIIEYIVRR